MSDTTTKSVVMRWEHPRDAARDAVVWGLVEDAAKERKDAARAFVADYLNREASRGVDAYAADGTLIGSITRSKPSWKRDVDDWAAFLQWVIANRPDMLTIDYRTKDAFLNTLTEVGEVFVDRQGLPVPGVWNRPTTGSIRVNKEKTARETVRTLLERVEALALEEGPPHDDSNA